MRVVLDTNLLVSSAIAQGAPRQLLEGVIKDDADDDYVLAAAVAGGAHLIASGDKRHVLPLRVYQGIPIVGAREALEKLYAHKQPRG